MIALCAAASLAQADGYYEGSKGARAAGRAGAFVARADDLSALHFNPAGLGHIEGTLLHIGNRLSYNAHRFARRSTRDFGNTPDGELVDFATVENSTPWQALDPILGAISDFGLEDFRFALGIYAPAGVARQEFPLGLGLYEAPPAGEEGRPRDAGQRYMMVKRDAKVINYTASMAWKHEDVLGVGVSLQWISVPELSYQLVIDAEYFGGVNPVSSALDMLATVEGDDLFTFNAIVGAWYRPAPFLELGVSGQVIPGEIGTDSRLKIEPLAPGIEEDVRLTRVAQPADDVTLTLPLPITARAGVRYIHYQDGRELFDIELDVGYEAWSTVDSFTLDSRGLVATLFGQQFDVGVIEIEKHWRDTVSLHLGGDYSVIPEAFTARAGVFYETALAPPAYAHVDFVGGSQLGGALGVSLLFGGVEVALAYEYRHMPEVSVSEQEARVYQETPLSLCEPPYTDPATCHPELLGQPGPVVNAGAYTADSSIVSLDVLYRL